MIEQNEAQPYFERPRINKSFGRVSCGLGHFRPIRRSGVTFRLDVTAQRPIPLLLKCRRRMPAILSDGYSAIVTFDRPGCSDAWSARAAKRSNGSTTGKCLANAGNSLGLAEPRRKIVMALALAVSFSTASWAAIGQSNK